MLMHLCPQVSQEHCAACHVEKKQENYPPLEPNPAWGDPLNMMWRD